MSEEEHPGRGRANSPGCVEGASRLEPRYFLRVARAHPRPLRTLCMSKSCYWIAIRHVRRQGVLGVMSRDVVESVEGYAANRRVVSVVVVEVEPAGQRQASFGL